MVATAVKETQAESSAEAIETIALQDASVDIWDSKYRLKSKQGESIDQSVEDSFIRVAPRVV